MVLEGTNRCRFVFIIDASTDTKSSVPFDVILWESALMPSLRRGSTNSGRFIDTWLPQRLVLVPKDENSRVDLPTLLWTPMRIRYDVPTPPPQGKCSHASAVLDDKPVLTKRLKQETPVTEKLQPPKLTKKPKKALRAQRHRNRISTLNDTTSLSPNIAPTSKPKFTADPVNAAESAASITGRNSSVTSTRPTLASTEAHSRGMSSPGPIPLLDGSLIMTSGLNFGRTQYVALEKTSMMAHGKLINVIGIVKSVSGPSLTSHGQQLTCTLKILDSSISSPEDSIGRDSDAIVNDVIILRDVKLENTEKLRYSTTVPVPYDIMIGEDTLGYAIVPSTRRVHKLIRDVDRKVFNGYFDCIVEVLSKSDNGDDSPYELYVTDYTKNDQVIPMRSKFWPSSLAERVLKIAMWDAALPIGRTMEQGRIYRMKNIRMIIGRSGGLEAKICERKISEPLDDKGHTDFDVHLQKFLERKKLWKSDGKVA
ncbi:hypothetical protein EDD18DRAFT_1359502 [Armillaria luteobubalina]|uniref:Protection of telomeres protein 1 ssDNA-binding domain-containing protein n=1 Tax=Armillaria luteobubalina TaxID=153913 RepID=A0AA39PSK3_9AGAR|nr:hypothetical protein EDD18DRAFT_1359502 [Armillaria luteobubalina]